MDYLGYAISAASGGGSSFDPLLIDSDLVPTDSVTYDVGRPSKRWRNGEFTTVNSTTLTAPTVTLTTLASTNPAINVTATNGLTANKYTVNGGTDQQYLMADGSRLQYSSNSGNSNFYLYKSGTSQSATPPAGFITYNDAVQDNATTIYISHLTRDNVDIDVFFNQITPITEVYIQDQELSDNFIQYNITSQPTPVPNAQVAINVQKRSSGGTGQNNFPDGRDIIMSFFTNGPEVDGRLTTLETKTANQTVVGGITTFPSVNAPIIDSASTIAFGTNTQTGLTIGRAAAVTNVRGSSIITTGNIIPTTNNTGTIGTSSLKYNNGFFTNLTPTSIDAAGLLPLSIGTTIQSGLTIGRVGSPTTINSSVLTITGTITGNLVPTVVSTQNLGSATNRWNVFAQTLTLPNTAGVRVTNFNSTSSNTVVNTTTATSLLGTGTGSLSLTDVSGTSRHVYCSGTISSLAAATITFRFGATGVTAFTNTYTLLVSSAVPFVFELDYTNRSTYYGMGRFQYGTNAPVLFQYLTGNTLGTNIYDLTAQWGAASASNTITANMGTVETLA